MLTIVERNAVVLSEIVEGADGQLHMVPPLRPRSSRAALRKHVTREGDRRDVLERLTNVG
jgi:hypothetical protein